MDESNLKHAHKTDLKSKSPLEMSSDFKQRHSVLNYEKCISFLSHGPVLHADVCKTPFGHSIYNPMSVSMATWLNN